jgi:hypothetical protein
MRHTSPQQAILSLAALSIALVACVGESMPYGYERIRKSDQYISEKTLSTIVDGKLSRADVIQRLGEPDAVNEDARSIGYERCISSEAYTIPVVLVPLPIPMRRFEITDCSRAGIWFDEQDRAVAWNELRRTGAADEPQMPLRAWLSDPGELRNQTPRP